MIYVDTSSFLALVHTDDEHHQAAIQHWRRLLSDSTPLFTNNYVLIESIAIIQNRVGLKAVRTLVNDILPVVHVEWLDAQQHEIAVQNMLAANRRNLSLVDCASFDTMRRLGIRTAFAFDPHFVEQGFDCVP